MNKKIGLVIQGPLLSIGRAGNNLHASVDKLKSEGGVIHFDCRENINSIIKEFGHLFSEVVVSTWQNEVKPGESFEGAKLVASPDPGGIKQVGHYKDNNKFRQFLSTLNGIKELEKSGVEYVLKMRTDQHLDLNRLVDSFFKEMEKHSNPKAIGATVIHPPTFLLHDLYFMSRLDALKEFCEAILGYERFEFIDSVHREMVLKHAYYSYRKDIGVSDPAYFPIAPPQGVSGATRKIFDYMFDNVYFDLDPELFRKTLWRGAYYETDHVDRLVNKAGPTRKFNIPLFISTDWDRYFHFRLQTSGTPISPGDNIQSKLGNFGWQIWNLIRKVVNMVR